jgi:hypothetical protein
MYLKGLIKSRITGWSISTAYPLISLLESEARDVWMPRFCWLGPDSHHHLAFLERPAHLFATPGGCNDLKERPNRLGMKQVSRRSRVRRGGFIRGLVFSIVCTVRVYIHTYIHNNVQFLLVVRSVLSRNERRRWLIGVGCKNQSHSILPGPSSPFSHSGGLVCWRW